MKTVLDGWNRPIDYLRVSVTDQCNLRCKYCFPDKGMNSTPSNALLSFDEITRLVRIGLATGITKVRLTGGEPLLRKNLVDLVGCLSQLDGLEDLAMTTNGILLGKQAATLRNAGLDRINISLDTLLPDRYRELTQGGNINDVLSSIETSLEVFNQIKINVVLLPDLSKEEISDFLRLSMKKKLEIRFLEYMPMGLISLAGAPSVNDVLSIASTLGCVKSAKSDKNNTAVMYQFENAHGSFGFITPMTKKFCSTCNRLRLSCDGLLRSCLHANLTTDLRAAIRSSSTDEELKNLFLQAIKLKPAEHTLDSHPRLINSESMCGIGG